MDETAKKELKKNQITTKKNELVEKDKIIIEMFEIWNLIHKMNSKILNLLKKKRPKSEKQMESG